MVEGELKNFVDTSQWRKSCTLVICNDEVLARVFLLVVVVKAKESFFLL